MAPLLALTGTRFGSVLERIEAEKFEPRSLIRDHRSDTEVRVQAEISVPALELRSYSDVMSAPPQVVSKDNLLLVETYRHHLYPRMANRMITENAPRFGQIRRDVTRPVPIAGTYFHWDSEWPGHYGHVLTEQVSKLWGLEGARRRHPDLKVLLGRRPRETRAMSFERAILAAVGVPEEDILLYDKPVRIQRLIAATPMFSMPDYVSPRVHETWNFLGREIVTQASDRPTPRRIFCGRQRNNRSCLNAGEVEATFTEFGFEVVFPEHMSFPDQIAMFRNAEVVAGYAGSALFTVMFCDDPKPMIMLAPESYMGCNNEYLIAAVLGNSIDVFWSVPEGASPIAPYYVDFQREGRLLREHLRSLG
jgi:hypothetical protein